MSGGDALRALMRCVPQPVTVVTAVGPDGPRGMTASAFLSASLDPPLLLVSVSRESQAHAAVAAGRFRVHVLADDQADVSNHFATPGLSSGQQFSGRFEAAVADPGRSPRLAGCLAAADCRTVAAHEAGDHTLFVGEVERSEVGRPSAAPLVYYSRSYRRVGDPAGEDAA